MILICIAIFILFLLPIGVKSIFPELIQYKFIFWTYVILSVLSYFFLFTIGFLRAFPNLEFLVFDGITLAIIIAGVSVGVISFLLRSFIKLFPLFNKRDLFGGRES